MNNMNNFQKTECIENAQCLACGNKNIRTILDLGKQPLANSYHKGEILPTYPLKLNLCTECFHLQQSHAVHPDLMFKNYLYVSGTTKTLHQYFEDFSKKTLEYYPKAKNILDIACNDGTQLDYYKKIGLTTYGIDPAENLYEECAKKGHEVVCDYFTKASAARLEKKFDLITAQNVFAHTRYEYEFLLDCAEIMHDESVLFIQTSQANMIVNNEFDTIYHEHMSFFNTLSMKTLVERAGLVLSDVFKTDIHGTSYVFVITKNGHIKGLGVEENLDSEKKDGLYDMVTYGDYVSKCYHATFTLKNRIEEFRKDGYVIAGYGAAAKGNTFLNFGNIKLDFVVDDNPLKCNLMTPGQDIPIVPVSHIASLGEEEKVVFVPLAWNFYAEIKKRVLEVRNNKNDFFVRYFPKFIVDK